MNRVKCLVLLIYISVNIIAQQKSPELLKYSNLSLFNLSDTVCNDLSGEWVGEEVQYDPTKSFIKVKFKVVFNLTQEGNRIYGTSYIEDKYRGSYGDMKIRGIVIGNKFHFEEYEILDEKFYQKGYVWCLRSGEMIIKHSDGGMTLEGIEYNGYASDNYEKCTDYVRMSISKAIKPSSKKEVLEDSKKSLEVIVFPNPFLEDATIAYELQETSMVRIDVFTLSGSYLKTILNEKIGIGKHKATFNLASAAAGVYLLRFIHGNTVLTKQVVKSK